MRAQIKNQIWTHNIASTAHEAYYLSFFESLSKYVKIKSWAPYRGMKNIKMTQT